MKKILAVVAVSLLVANCSATTKTTAYPRLGYGGFSDPTIIPQTGAPGGFGGF